MPFIPSSRHAPAVPLGGPPIMKKIVSTFSFLKQRAIICSPRMIAISLILSSWSSQIVGATQPPPCQERRVREPNRLRSQSPCTIDLDLPADAQYLLDHRR